MKLETLEVSHATIETHLQSLENLVSHLGLHGADDKARRDAAAVIGCFDGPARDHHRYEDESLFPLLRSVAAEGGRPEICATLYELEREHDQMELLYAPLRHKLLAIQEEGANRLDAEEVAHFAWLYRRHMQLETQVIQPFADEAL